MIRAFFYIAILFIPLQLFSRNYDAPIAEKKLPLVKSFVLEAVEGAPEESKGLNVFEYDLEGRVLTYSTPVQKTTFTYNGTKCSGFVNAMPSGEKIQEQSLTFNKKELPLSGKITQLKDGMLINTKYEYNTAGRLENYRFSSNEKIVNCILEYDSLTSRPKNINTVQSVGNDDRKVSYRLEYTDIDNPVALYLVCVLCIDYEPAFAFPGLDGFSCDKLVNKIIASTDGIDYYEYSFEYGFSDDGMLTSINLNVSWYDENGNLNPGGVLMKLSNIKY